MVYYSPRPLAAVSLPAAIAVVLLAVVMLTPPCAAQRSSWKNDTVDLHNVARADVSVKALKWNESLATYALGYAKERQDDCKLKVSGGPYGENLFFGPAGKNYTAVDVVGEWVAQKQYYDHDTNTCAEGEKCDWYTQVVWRSTTSIGCAAVACTDDSGIFVVCSYNPPGNLDGESPY